MKTYMIRTCSADMTSYGGFTWPESGDVTCPDWDPKPHCGHGLHGLWLGCGRGDLLDWADNAKWLIVEIDRENIVDLNGKIKVPKGAVILCGTREEALTRLEALAPECLAMPVVGANRTAGDNGTATVGFRGTATAGFEGIATAGHHGTATAGSCGQAKVGVEGTATVGHYGFATAGYQGSATAGDWGTAIASENGSAIAGYQGTATAGYNGKAMTGWQGTATAGVYGTAIAGSYGKATAGNWGHAMTGDWGHSMAGACGRATAGIGGKISIDWYDTKTDRMRTLTGYVGEDGIEPNKPYRVDPTKGTLYMAY